MNNLTYLPNVLVGINTPYFHHTVNIIKESLNWSPDWTFRPIMPSGSIDPKNYPRSQTSVFVESNEQAIKELSEEYSHKSMMSLDGIFSPISFYPTPYSATFNITKYPTPNCPFCFGTKIHKYSLIPDGRLPGAPAAGDFKNIIQEKEQPCSFCESYEKKREKSYLGVSPKEMMPPYIVSSGIDDVIISGLLAGSGLTGVPIINYATLNPIVLTTGEFSNFQNKQQGDACGHTIDLVSFGLTVPRFGDGLRSSYNARIERSYVDYDMNLIDWRNNAINNGVAIPDVPLIANNMRFFGLRGPLMLHSWGYDVEGYPVPNSSGEPLMSGLSLVRDGNNNVLGKNQKFKDGAWTKPYKENTFYKGWAQQPGSWPVGPIDLRWDDKAGVWTIPNNYKTVHVIIEEDLINNNPSRGAIVDDTYDNSPLPSGLRKLVFVKDAIGVYSAPRGAALYCKYNSNNGFYEPIGFQPFITSGIINSYNTVNIYKVYTKPNNPSIKLSDDPKLEQYTTIYKNPLNYKISVGDIGLFTFINGYWVLQSFNCN